MPTDDFEKRVADTLLIIQESDSIHPRNKQLIADYKRDKLLDGLKHSTLSENLSRLKLVAEHVGDRPFDEMDESDVENLVEWLHSKYGNQETLYTYKSVVKSLWKWMGESEEYPETVE
jgi:hypothetical protein